MAKLVVITDPTMAPGFRLAGVEVHAANTVDEARRLLMALIEEGEAGVIAMNASYLEALDDIMRRRIEASYKPVVVALPSGEAVTPEARRSRQIAELIRRAIGVRITFRGEEATDG
ncbi:MAG TPA: V-type ATP synthase subunit F [Alphaproteobacteria bacterium]|nr:V-type ATP synthase subunit F [Alphaproteobacteria bacterium]